MTAAFSKDLACMQLQIGCTWYEHPGQNAREGDGWPSFEVGPWSRAGEVLESLWTLVACSFDQGAPWDLQILISSKATLPLTIPRRVFKSSAKDSTRRSVEIVIQGGPRNSSATRASPTTRAFGGHKPLLRVGNRTAGACVASSPDSDLEAFSHNPAHGSFAPLAFQPSAMTNCANQRFLSY
ncbi:hypothetical protein M0R45_007176 [Rubus argutus]|uniref:Uncharacterized protein n=1 Tax=Rubus argutus TaxID=59490 RepID=A0AAW1YSL2_RUBAR